MDNQPAVSEQEGHVASAVSSEVIISLKKVSKYFGDFQALNGIDLDVHTGERIVIDAYSVYQPTRRTSRG